MKSTALIPTALEHVFQQFVGAINTVKGDLPYVEYDANWLSPCEVGKPNKDGMVAWKPTAVNEKLTFDNVEEALGVLLHEDIKAYFCYGYSESISAKSDDGELELLFAWNRDDFDRLQQNIIGHILMKRRLKQPITVFFAVTDEEDFIISINNENGEVWVEQVGCIPHKKLADNLSEFLTQKLVFE